MRSHTRCHVSTKGALQLGIVVAEEVDMALEKPRTQGWLCEGTRL